MIHPVAANTCPYLGDVGHAIRGQGARTHNIGPTTPFKTMGRQIARATHCVSLSAIQGQSICKRRIDIEIRRPGPDGHMACRRDAEAAIDVKRTA